MYEEFLFLFCIFLNFKLCPFKLNTVCNPIASYEVDQGFNQNEITLSFK